MKKKASLAEFLKAIVANWSSRISGGLSVPLTIVGLYVSDRPLKYMFLALALLTFLFAIYIIWQEERDQLIKTQEELMRELDRRPSPELFIEELLTKTQYEQPGFTIANRGGATAVSALAYLR